MEGNDMLNTICLEEYGKDLHLCSNEECFHALMKLVAQKGRDRIVKDNGQKGILHFCRVPYRKAFIQ